MKWTAGALACGLMIAGALTANAQVATGKGQHGQRMAKLAQALGLTDSQKEQIKPILKDAKAQKQAIEADTKLTPEEKKAKFKELRKATHEKIGAILTPEQKTKLKEMRQAHQHSAGNKV
jgi:Spy/CpxP family protein refolding chaperone